MSSANIQPIPHTSTAALYSQALKHSSGGLYQRVTTVVVVVVVRVLLVEETKW
jgi:hypothetical protein